MIFLIDYVKEKKMRKNLKRYHFRGKWKNGDNRVIWSDGNNKKDAFFSMLKAIKEKKFKHRAGDGFYMSYMTNEEAQRNYQKSGFNRNSANMLSVYGHTTYILKDGEVIIN